MDIREIRKKLGITQEQLAHKLGVTYTTVNRWEAGKSKPSPLALDRLKTMQEGSNESR